MGFFSLLFRLTFSAPPYMIYMMKKTPAKTSASKSATSRSLRIPYRVKIVVTMGLALLIILSLTSLALYRLASRRIIEEFGQKLITVVVNGEIGRASCRER